MRESRDLSGSPYRGADRRAIVVLADVHGELAPAATVPAVALKPRVQDVAQIRRVPRVRAHRELILAPSLAQDGHLKVTSGHALSVRQDTGQGKQVNA